MTDRLRVTILGCGSSPGVPRITGDWGACDPANPKNRRRRCSALFERIRDNGASTRVVIDTGPDFRDQMIDAGVETLDGVLYTHAHADHTHGIDDLRGFVLNQKRLMDIYADLPTMTRLREGFGYCFETPRDSNYPPLLKAHLISHDSDIVIEGAGGTLTFRPVPQIHGDMLSLGFRVAGIAYCPDVSDIPKLSVPLLMGLDLLIIDALQYRAHPSHFSLDETLAWIEKLSPKRAVLTHMHTPLDYDTVMRETPENVEPAFDGMAVEVRLSSD